jgi:hypothetical protein
MKKQGAFVAKRPLFAAVFLSLASAAAGGGAAFAGKRHPGRVYETDQQDDGESKQRFKNFTRHEATPVDPLGYAQEDVRPSNKPNW